ncbi:MAG: hypothetical protein CVT88_00550 [Candidatus Altiarchaeales archaeon HGW-Altiarchaeales-1]|nr:MAG: hypothetical protein CVT88_00550 [Candidatus Altiarchaeales archaeon HGW-Altiarchaeales-1]
MDIIFVILVAVALSGGIFFLIYQLVSLPIRTSDPSDKSAIRYCKTKSYFRSGEAPPSFFGEDLVKTMEEKGAQIIAEDMVCIGKRTDNSFVSSPLLLSYFSQKGERKTEIKVIKNGACLKEDGTSYHPNHFHYRIFDNAIFFHRGDNITYYLRGSWYLKKKFKKRFDKEWKEGTTLDEKIFPETDKLLVELDYHRYEKARKEEIEKFKKEAKIEN